MKRPAVLTRVRTLMPKIAVVLALILVQLSYAQITVARTSSDDTIFIGKQENRARGMYVSYTITNTGADLTDVWVKLDVFTGGIVSLAQDGATVLEDGLVHLGELLGGAVNSKTAFFYLSATATSTTAQTHQVKVYDRRPDIAGAVLLNDAGGGGGPVFSYSGNASYDSVNDAIEANPNKVQPETFVVGPNPPVLGGIVTITFQGTTGTIGSDGALLFTPAAFLNWDAEALELFETVVVLDEPGCTAGPTCNDGTFTNDLAIEFATGELPSTTATGYTATYKFRAVGTTDAPTAISTIAYITSGNDFKHTATGDLASIAPILSPENTMILSKSVDRNGLPIEGPGETEIVTYTLTLDNTSPTPASVEVFRDIMPAGATYLGPSLYDGDPIDDPVDDSGTLIWSGTFAAPGNGSATLTYQVALPTDAPTTHTNSAIAEIGSVQIDSTLATNDDAPASVSVFVPPTTLADLSVTKTASTEALPPGGGTLTYTIDVSNAGPSAADGVVLTDTVQADVQNPEFSTNGGGLWLPWTGSLALGTIASGASQEVLIRGTVSAAFTGTISNTASVSATTSDPTSSNNTSEPAVTVVDLALRTSKTTSTPNVVNTPTGTQATYTITATNDAGATTAAGVYITDVLPADFSYDGGTAPSIVLAGGAVRDLIVDPAHGATSPSWGSFTIPAGGSVAITFVADVASTVTDGTYDNSATVSSSTAGVVTSDFNGAVASSDDVTVTVPPPQDYGDAPDTYGTLEASGGPHHDIAADLYLGITPPDEDSDGFGDGSDDAPAGDAADDDLEGSDDEDGIASLPQLTDAMTAYSVDVTVTNNTGGNATLYGWLDFDLSGTFEADEIATTTVADGTSGGTAALTWSTIPNDIVPGASYLRLRFDTLGGLGPTGVGGSGEVEDYTITIDESADLRLVKTVNEASPLAGNLVAYTLTLDNDGPDGADNVTVTDSLPTGVAFVSSTASQGSYDDGTGIWTVGTLANGGSATLQIVVDVGTDQGGNTIVNIAEVTASDQSDPDSAPDNDDGDQSEDDEDGASITVVAGPPYGSNVCYLVADGGDRFTVFDLDTSSEIDVGPLGATGVEGGAYWPGTDTLYAANAGILGSIDTATGAFTPIGSGIGGGFNDIDGMTFDPFTGILYGSVRVGAGPDLLIQIDTATGTFVANAFDTDNDDIGDADSVVIDTSVVGRSDIDDIAIDPFDGQMYGSANNGGPDRLVAIDKGSGAVTDQGAMGVNDMEGLAFTTNEALMGATGGGSSSLYDIAKSTGIASNARPLGFGGIYTDYETLDCNIAPVNSVSGRVFADIDEDGDDESDTDPGFAGAVVRLYRDIGTIGLVEPGTDILLTSDLSGGTGAFAFEMAAQGDFVLDVDTTTLPNNHIATTDNVETATFASGGNTDTNNDFGHTVLDFGDAPDSYGTLLASGGARHRIDGNLYLGALAPDADLDGFGDGSDDTPAGDAADDDNEGSDDEDGVTSFPALATDATSYTVPAASISLVNTTGGAATLYGFIDFNTDGDFDDPGESASAAVGNGAVNPDTDLVWSGFTMTATPGGSYARFRLGTDGALGPGGGAGDGEVEDYPLVIEAAGSVLSGTLFYDDGLGGGTPHDGIQNGGELGASGIVVTASDGTGSLSAVTDANGDYSLTIPETFGGSVTVSHGLQPATGTSIAGAAPTACLAGALGDTAAAEQLIGDVDCSGVIDGAETGFAGGETYSGYDFGVVRTGTFISDRVGQVSSPGTIDYEHLFTPGSEGTVTVHLTGDDLDYQLFVDEGCDGSYGAGEGPHDFPYVFTIDASWPRLGDGSLQTCNLRVRVLVPDGWTEGQTDIVEIGADLVWSTNPNTVTDTTVVIDTTVVSSGGQLELVKEVCNVTQGCTYGATSQGRPGEILEYRIAFRNLGSDDVTDIRLSDPVPFFTTLALDPYGLFGEVELVCPDGTVIELDTGAVTTVAVDISTACGIGAVAAGESGTLRYRTVID